jgi:hypothetical protein
MFSDAYESARRRGAVRNGGSRGASNDASLCASSSSSSTRIPFCDALERQLRVASALSTSGEKLRRFKR